MFTLLSTLCLPSLPSFVPPPPQVKTGFFSKISIVVCMLPVGLATLWLVIELVVTLVRVRRVMLQEDLKRKMWVRNIRRQRRREQSTIERALQLERDSSASSTTSVIDERRLGTPPPSSTAHKRTLSGKDAVEVEDAPVALLEEGRKGNGGGSGGGSMRGGGEKGIEERGGNEALSSKEEVRWTSPFPSPTPAGKDDSSPKRESGSGEWREKATDERKREKKEEEKLSRAAVSRAGLLGTALPPKSPLLSDPPSFTSSSRQDLKRPKNMSEVLTRGVRVSFLLQSWLRLWLSMAFFTLVAISLMLLLALRFSSLTLKVSMAAVSIPLLVALLVVALQSVLVHDGTSGSGGGLAVRAGAARSTLALGRRPLIFLAIICAPLVVIKLNAMECRYAGQELSRIDEWAVKVSWVFILLPYWLSTVLVEAVYLRALVENYTHENLSTTLFGDRTLGFLLCWWGDADDAWRCPGSRRGRGDLFYSSSIRRRAELTPSQRAAATSFVCGFFLMAACVVSLANRVSSDRTASWGIPITVLMATLACATIGAGLYRIALAHHRSICGGLPPPAKPLPVFFSERQGGWVVGPADPPKVQIFLLGDVTLRQEGFSRDASERVDQGDNVIIF